MNTHDFAHVESAPLRAYLTGQPGGMTAAEALDYSMDCLEADLRAEETGMGIAIHPKAMKIRESAFEDAREAFRESDLDATRDLLRTMWSH